MFVGGEVAQAVLERLHSLGELIDRLFGPVLKGGLLESIRQGRAGEPLASAGPTASVGLPSGEKNPNMHLVFLAFEPSEETLQATETVLAGSLFNQLPVLLFEGLDRLIQRQVKIGSKFDQFLQFVVVSRGSPWSDGSLAKAQRLVRYDLVHIERRGFAKPGAFGTSSDGAIETKEPRFGRWNDPSAARAPKLGGERDGFKPRAIDFDAACSRACSRFRLDEHNDLFGTSLQRQFDRLASRDLDRRADPKPLDRDIGLACLRKRGGEFFLVIGKFDRGALNDQSDPS